MDAPELINLLTLIHFSLRAHCWQLMAGSDYNLNVSWGVAYAWGNCILYFLWNIIHSIKRQLDRVHEINEFWSWLSAAGNTLDLFLLYL